MIGRTLSHFRILAKIGEGGMGVVYRAEDEKLRRPVALKLLPADLVADEERRRRFLREARAAAAVTHPNIAMVLEVGEAEGITFIAMELVDGRTLRQFFGARPLPVSDALRFAAGIAEGLASAHKARVIHRDLKPENVMVRADGHVKILDFGLARLHEERLEADRSFPSHGETLSARMTREGAIVGTVAYMSPEQARGVPVDARSDLFSFGIMMYEMVTGRVPFRGQTTTDTLTAILRDEPISAARINPAVPPELDRIIAKCLQKPVEDRYQHAEGIGADLHAILRRIESGALDEGTFGGQAVGPWAGRWRRWIGGGTRGLVSGRTQAARPVMGGIAGWWNVRPAARFNPGEKILIADFENHTGDAEFDTVIRDAFEERLARSRRLRVVTRDRLQDGAPMREPEPGSRVDSEAASRICREKGYAGYLMGRILTEGTGYRLEASLHRAGRDHRSIIRSAAARTKHDILLAIHEMVLDFRRTLGEDPRAVSNTIAPTTRSLRAYQAFMVASNLPSPDEQVALYKRALEIDAAFVEAYARLAQAYEALGESRNYREAVKQAHRRSTGLPESVRLINEIDFLKATYNFETEVERLKTYQRLYPFDAVGPSRLGWLYLYVYQDPDLAAPALRACHQLEPDLRSLLSLSQCLLLQGRAEEIVPLVADFRTRGGSEKDAHVALLHVPLSHGEWREVHKAVAILEGEPGIPRAYGIFARFLALLAAGRLQDARTAGASAWRAAEDARMVVYQLWIGLAQAWLDKHRSGKSPALSPDLIKPAKESLLFFPSLAIFCVDTKLVQPLESLIKEHELAEKDSKSRFVREELQFGQCCLALIRGENEKAREALEPLARNSILSRHHHVLGQTYEALGHWADAAAEYEEILENPHRKWFFDNPALWALDQFRLARVYETMGDPERARRWYGRFLTDWKDADPDIPELIEARQRLAVLRGTETLAN